MAQMFVPTLSYWEYGNVWTGEHGAARFRVTPKDGDMLAEIWRGPMSYECSEVEQSEHFPVTQEGIDALTAWLLEQSEQMTQAANEFS